MITPRKKTPEKNKYLIKVPPLPGVICRGWMYLLGNIHTLLLGHLNAVLLLHILALHGGDSHAHLLPANVGAHRLISKGALTDSLGRALLL